VPWNLLILPLLAGYYYCTRSYSSKYHYRRLDGYRFLLGVAFSGAVFLVVAFLLDICLVVALGLLSQHNVGWATSLLKAWHPPYPHLGKTGLSLLLAIGWTNLRNWKRNDDEPQRRRVIGEEGLYLEALNFRAFDEGKPLLVSLKSGKVYLCHPLEGTHPNIDHTYIPVIPLRSGGRNKDTQEITFTTDYEPVYESLRASGKEEMIDDFELILPTSEILSATIFDPETYKTTFSKEQAGGSSQGD